jgi:hypothetical protein
LLTAAGAQVPVIPFTDAVGNVTTASPSQIEALAPKVNVGVTIGLTVTVRVTGGVHGVEELVNV